MTSPWPRTLSGRRSRRTSPACLEGVGVDRDRRALLGCSLPASIAALIAPTLTTSYSMSLMLRKPRSFGIRMWSGVWPPSNHAGIEAPARERWPFVPRPAVLPLPAAMPRPTRVFLVTDPSAGRRSWIFISSFSGVVASAPSGSSSTVTRKRDLADHAADGGVVRQDRRAADAVQAQRADRRPVAGDVADRALGLGDAEPTGHRPPPGPRRSPRPAGRGRRGGA